MIAKIYPDGHSDLADKRDPTHPVRYFDIRKLTPRECLRLMGVPEKWIDKFFTTRAKAYLAYEGVDNELAMFGLEASATAEEVRAAYKEQTSGLFERGELIKQFLDTYNAADLAFMEEERARLWALLNAEEQDEEPGDEIAGNGGCADEGSDKGEPADDGPTDEDVAALREEYAALGATAENYGMAYTKILEAQRVAKVGDIPILSNSSIYKLAGNSIVCDVLMYIYEALLMPEAIKRVPGEINDMFALPPFMMPMAMDGKLRLVTLCSGYDSQCIAFEMLKERYPGFDYELMAWSEFDPESRRKLEEQPAVVAHNLLFPQWADRNRGDMTKADWSDLADANIDLLTYSTPCQSISQAGKREGLKRDSGTRSAVLWSTEDAVKVMRPKVLLQENVRALINKVNMADFREWCEVLEKQGYVNFLAPSFPKPWGKDKRDKKTIPGILNAKDYGVAQNRERVYMVSVRKDILGDTQVEFPRPFPLNQCIADVLEENVDEKFFIRPDAVIKFLQKNDNGNDTTGIFYCATDHKLTDDEIAEIRKGGSA